jgi:quinol monooxygenase YgiN
VTQQVIVIAKVKAQPGTLEELLAAQAILVQATRAEAGCIRYELNVSINDPDTVVFVETWESEALLQAHLNGSAIAAFNQSSGHLVAGVTLEKYRQVA